MTDRRVIYQKRITTKLVRTEHVIGLWFGMEALDLKGAAARVPNVAKLVDVEEDENGDMLLVFIEEKKDDASA